MEQPQLVNLNICGGCQTLDRGMDHCARCRVMFYCSKRCQERHWSSPGHPHSKECVKFDKSLDPQVYYVKAQYREIPSEGFPQEEVQDAIDKHIIGLIEAARKVEHSYRFVARGQVCGGWLLGELHSDNPHHLFSKAVLAGRWIFCIGPNRRVGARLGEYQISAFISHLYADFIIVDAPPNADEGLSPAQILLDWMIECIAPLAGLKFQADERPPEWMATNLKEIVLFEFIYKPPVVVESMMVEQQATTREAV